MKIKTVFLDRDGIINEPIHRGEIISSPRSLDEFQLTHDFPGLYTAIRDLNLFVVSNQPDVTRGLLAPAALKAISDRMAADFAFTEIIYCTHDDSCDCNCRKPKPGMIERVLREHNLHPDEAVIIGDSYKDILAGQAAGIRTIYCRRSYNSTISCKPDFVVSGLAEIPLLPIFTALS